MSSLPVRTRRGMAQRQFEEEMLLGDERMPLRG